MDQGSNDISPIISDSGDTIAHGWLTQVGPMRNIKELPGVELKLYYFAQVKLEPVTVFKHLSGVPLKTFFDRCSVILPGQVTVGPLAYIHGKSEVMRGKHFTSAVLLADIKSESPIPELKWMSAMPGIFKRFTAGVFGDGETEKS